MKTVFTNSQVAHIWANQSQDHGRNSSDTLYFRGTEIFSYGSHFKAARIHEVNGVKLALLTSRSYSTTTSQHMSDIRSGLRGLMNYYVVPNIDHPSSDENLTYFTDKLKNAFNEARSTRIKIDSKWAIKYRLESLDSLVNEANAYFKAVGFSKYVPPQETIDCIVSNLKARFARYQELNTPEMIAKRDAERVRRDLKDKDIQEAKFKKAIADFKAGIGHQVFGGTLPYELLSVRGDEVLTSRGARVPLSDAKRALMFISNIETSKVYNLDYRIGNFELNQIVPLENGDKVLIIGCHRILLSEVIETLKAVA